MTTTMADAKQGKRRAGNTGSSSKLGDDYPLRFAPRHYRTWTPVAVAGSALGGMAYLADFSIGAGIGIAHGTTNAVVGILIAAVLIFSPARRWQSTPQSSISTSTSSHAVPALATTAP